MTFLKTKKDNSQRSVVNALILIRSLYNRAIKMGIVDRKHYPFGTDKIRIKLPETEKIGLSVEEVRISSFFNYHDYTISIKLYSQGF